MFKRNQQLWLGKKRIPVKYVKMFDKRMRPNYVVVELPCGERVTCWMQDLHLTKDNE